MTFTSGFISGPHQAIQVEQPRDRFTALLLDTLWHTYRQQVSYVQMYEQLLRLHGATFVNDHIAFRTIATQQLGTGIHSIARIFEALGYQPAGTYVFPDKHLSAIHYQHPISEFPKLFISELRTWELAAAERAIIHNVLAEHRAPVSEELLSQLHGFHERTATEPLLQTLVDGLTTLPWQPPEKDQLFNLNRTSQYGAWVLVHGYKVNHFTSLINSHNCESLNDIEKTVSVLTNAGIPMKAEIEGAAGSPLRQTATEAVTLEVAVREQGIVTTIPWTYAYFELAQRDWMIDSKTQQRSRFEGFLGSQATQLFEMTRIK